MHALFQIVKEVETPVNIMLHLFDYLVASILNYGYEPWGFLNAECIERIHRKFLKYILHVKIQTNNYAIYIFRTWKTPFKYRKTCPNYKILV